MNEYMDTVDPRMERAFTRTGRHVHVHPAKYMVRWGVSLTLAIATVVAIAIWA